MKKPLLFLLLFSLILMKAQTSLVSQEVNRYYKAGEYAKVIEIINKQNRDSVSVADWILMGKSFNYLKQYQNAEEVFQSLLRKDQSLINVYAYLAKTRITSILPMCISLSCLIIKPFCRKPEMIPPGGSG